MSFRQNITKKRIIFITAIPGIVAIYLISMLVFDAIHSTSATVKAFKSAVRAGDNGRVSAMLDQTHGKIPSWQVQGFTSYYNANPTALGTMLSFIETHAKTHNQSVSSSADGYLQASNVLGFRTFKLHLPMHPYRFTAPTGTVFTSEGSKVASAGSLLPGNYIIQATHASPFGFVTDDETIDTSSSSGRIHVPFFTNDMLTLSSSDIVGKASLLINNQAAGQVIFQNSDNPIAQAGPFPLQSVGDVSVQVSEPWGDFVESGFAINGRVDLIADPTYELPTAKVIAQTLMKLNAQEDIDTSTGNTQPELQYVAKDSPVYQRITTNPKMGPSSDKFLTPKMNFSPYMLLTPLKGGKVGLWIAVSPYSILNGWATETRMSYTMEYNSQTRQWQVYDTGYSPQMIPDVPPNFQLHSNH